MAAKFPEDAPDVVLELKNDLESKKDLDMLNCSICKEKFTDPKVLPCLHTFCSGCLEKYYLSHVVGEETPETLPCPVCRSVFTVPDEGIMELHKNAKPGAISELSKMNDKFLQEKSPLCDVCKYKKHEVNARDHCTHCGINYCGVCARDHDCHTLFRSHATVPIRDMAATKTVMRCEVHAAEEVRYYCQTCSSPLCTVCAVAEHREHQTMEMAAALGNKKDTVQGKMAIMTDKVQKHEQLLITLEDVLSVREAAVKKTRQEIERHTNALINRIQENKEHMFEDVDRAHSAGIKLINIEKENCAFQLANMKSLWKFAAKLTEPSQAIQLIAMHGDLMKMVDNVVEAPDPALARDVLTVNMFMPKESLQIGDLQKCELSVDTVNRISEVAEATNGYESPPRAQSPVPLANYVFYEELTLKWQAPKLMWKIDKTGNKPGEIAEAYDVAILPGGDVVVAEWLSQRLQIFDSSGYSKDVIGQNEIQPWGVTVTRDGNLATTDEKDRTVKIFSPNGYQTLSWKKLTFGWPRGLVQNRAGQFIVTDNQHGRHCVAIHLPDGQCVRQFGSQGSGNEQFHWPRYVTSDRHDRIIVADSSNHCVKIFDATGRYQLKFGSLGSGDGQMKHPRGVCVDPNSNILVADQDNNRVSLYSPDGKFIRHVLQNIQKPWGVDLNERGYLAVTHKPALCYYKVFEPMP